MSDESESIAFRPLPSVSLSGDRDLSRVVFYDLVLRERLVHTRSAIWKAERLVAFGESVASDRGNGRSVSVTRHGDCLAWIALDAGRLTLVAASARRSALDELIDEARSRMPPPERIGQRIEAPVNFWTSAHGGWCRSRRLEMRRWSEIAENYAPAVRTGLDELMQRSDPPEDGNLVLWQGPPGTGKTNALRALGWEWRHWCEIEYVVDPEALLGERPEYLMTVLMSEDEAASGPAGDHPDPRWRLLVLEDSGELVRADAKQETGQALSRLLNVVDGMVGQGLRILVLITTNEELGRLHPAITRPGRCLSTIEFTRLDRQAASTWLAERGIRREVGSATTLADLFAIAAGKEPEGDAGRVGFAA